MIIVEETLQKTEFWGLLQKDEISQIRDYNKALNTGINTVMETECIPMRIKPQELDQHGQSLQVAASAKTK